MDESKLDVASLRRRTPSAWTNLLRSQPGLEDVVVTAVSAVPTHRDQTRPYSRDLMRYLLSIDNHADPISFITKYTNRQEALFYEYLARKLPELAPKAWFVHVFNNEGWLILEDVPNHHPPHRWQPSDLNEVIHSMASLHATFWQRDDYLATLGFSHLLNGRQYTFEQLRQEQAVYFERGPGTPVSDHAIASAGPLAPLLLQAANGLTVLRDLGGWPGILGETHLTAVADLLDDPVPMLEPLHNLPVTLLHGDPHAYHWRMTLFEQHRLLDWRNAQIGPGICDLICFLEQFDLLYLDSSRSQIMVRPEWPMTEETLVDSYLLELSTAVPHFDARQARLALPAARCLYVITNWLPYFATWFDDMPSKYVWQRVNRLSDDQLHNSDFQPMVRYRPYLANVFSRFLLAFRTL